ncbi:hypothetical protein ACOZ38_39500 [Sphaerisporangium viridialbum]|uniref:hypothetical protein n=1 Tax=Sphaerisporangium viridialbum TaxID=46189 RepID=UPI003C77299F
MSADTLAGLLQARARDDGPGLLFEDRTWSWRAYVAECRDRAAWLSGLARGRSAGEPDASHSGLEH